MDSELIPVENCTGRVSDDFFNLQSIPMGKHQGINEDIRQFVSDFASWFLFDGLDFFRILPKKPMIYAFILDFARPLYRPQRYRTSTISKDGYG
jgi:hypothetical protein